MLTLLLTGGLLGLTLINLKYPWDYTPPSEQTPQEKQQWGTGSGGSSGGSSSSGSTSSGSNTTPTTTPTTPQVTPNPSGLVYPWDYTKEPTQTEIVQWGLKEESNTSYSAAIAQGKISSNTTPDQYYSGTGVSYPTLKASSKTTTQTPNLLVGLPTQQQATPTATKQQLEVDKSQFTPNGEMRALTEEEKKKQNSLLGGFFKNSLIGNAASFIFGGQYSEGAQELSRIRGGTYTMTTDKKQKAEEGKFLLGSLGGYGLDLSSIAGTGEVIETIKGAGKAGNAWKTTLGKDVFKNPFTNKELFTIELLKPEAQTVITATEAGKTVLSTTKAGKALEQGVLGIKKVTDVIPKNFITGTATTVGAGLAGYEGTKEYYKARTGVTGEERTTVKANLKAFEAGREAEGASKDTLIGNVAYNVMPVAFGNEEAFLGGAQKYLESQGKSPKEVGTTLTALEKERTARNLGSFGGQMAAGAGSEYVGQQNVAKALTGTAKPTFKTLFMPIAKAGFGEGFVQPIISQKTEGDTRAFFTGRKETNLFGLKVPLTKFEEAGVAGGFGFITAGTLGGAIGSTAAKGKKTTSKALEYFGYALDPFEKPSDILEEVVVGTGTKVKVATLTPVPVASNTPVSTTTQTQQGFKPKAPVNIMTGVPVSTNTNVPVSTKTNTPTNIFTNVPTDTNEPSKPRPTHTITDIITDIPIPVDTNTPTDTQTDTNVPVDTNTNTPTNVFTNVPVFTPISRLGVPPPIPMFDFGGGRGAAGGRKGKVGYVNELDVGRNMFNTFVGIPNMPQKQQKKQRGQQTPPKQKAPASSKAAPVRKNAGKTLNGMLFGRF